jgi:sugar lactone lactonase YvrE
VCALIVLTLSNASAGAAGCDAMGNVRFICDQLGPEDLILMPGAQWVLTSGYAANGALRAVSVRDKTTTVLFPTDAPRERLDGKAYPTCPGPIDATEREKRRIHGLSLRPGRNLVHTVYAIHHGNRESVEVFEVDGRAAPPTATWIGCVVAPDKTSLNSVVALPDGGFAVTNFQTAGAGRPQAGETSGEVWEWRARTGWAKVPGSEMSGPNGLEISKDGKWFYIGSWGGHAFVRLSRGRTPVKKDSVPVGFRLDNLRWAPDGALFAAGQGVVPDTPAGMSCIDKIDPKTLRVEALVRYPANDVFGGSTAAIQVGNDLWAGAVRAPADRLAVFPAAGSK